MFLTVYRNIFIKDKPKLYIEISDNIICLGLFSSSVVSNKEIFRFNNLEIFEGIIYNLPKVVEIINQYSKKHRLFKSETILSVPNILLIHSSKINFHIFHLAIALFAANLKITHVVSQALDQDNKLCLESCKNYKDNFLPPTNTNPYFWLFSTTVLIFLLMFSFYKIELSNLKSFSYLDSELSFIREEQKKMQNDLVCTKEVNDEFKRMNKFIEYAKNNGIVYEGLEKITNLFSFIPLKSLWLTKVRLHCDEEKSKKPKIQNNVENKQNIFLIEGCSLSSKEILSFYEEVKNLKSFKNVILEHLAHITNENSLKMNLDANSNNKIFEFKIKAYI